MKNIYYFFLVTFILFSNYVIGQDFTNVKVNHLDAGDQDTDGGNSIALYGNNVYVLWQDWESTYFCYVSKSTDGGETFNDGVTIGGNDPHLFGAIATDNSGSVYVAWDRIEGENINGVYFAKSIDQAATFSTPLTISAEGIFPQISVYGSNVYIFFIQSKENNKIGFFFARSTNGGTNFEAPYEISDASIDDLKFDSPTAMYVDNSGNIYCVWNDGRTDGAGSDIYFAKSTNSGISFTNNIMVNDIAGSSEKLRSGCSIAADGSNVYVAWRQEDDNQGSNRKILFSKSTNGGSSFSSETEIASLGFGSPALTVNSAGEIYLAYPQYSVEQNGIFCTKSNDEGNTFPVTTFINSVNANGKYISILVDGNDDLYMTWADDRSGEDNKDVIFAKGKITITDIEEVANIIPAQFELMQNYPNPFNPSTLIGYNLPVSSNVSLKIFDIIGKEIAVLVNEYQAPGVYEIEFNGAGLSNGVYIYKINAGSFFAVKKLLLIK